MTCRFFGGAKGIRTPDLLNAIQTRYQLRHDPIDVEHYSIFLIFCNRFEKFFVLRLFCRVLYVNIFIIKLTLRGL